MFSLSKIQCFEQCPLKYRLKYIDKVETERNSACKKGSSVHHIFENLDILETFRNPENEDALKVVDKFLESDIGKEFMPIIKDAQKEVKIGLNKGEGTLVPCDYSRNCLFGGIIDLLNGNHILDYKTGKAKTYNQQDWTQLTWYAIWLFLASDYEEVKITYIYVEHNTENTKILKRSDLNSMMVDMLSRFKNVKQFEENPTDKHCKSYLCDWCDCKKHCPFYTDNALNINTL